LVERNVILSELRAISAMLGPIEPEQMQLDLLSRNVFDALSESDDNPVWKAFVRFICYPNPVSATDLSQWSDRSVAAVANALASVEHMRTSPEAISKEVNIVADSFSDLEDEFIDYIFAGPQSENLLIVFYGPIRREGAFFVKCYNGLYFTGSTDELGVAGPYLSLDECLVHVRSVMFGRFKKKRLSGVVFSSPILIDFVEDLIVAACPVIGARFTLNGKLCARSDESAFVELSGCGSVGNLPPPIL
jgi:hypothetical protein